MQAMTATHEEKTPKKSKVAKDDANSDQKLEKPEARFDPASKLFVESSSDELETSSDEDSVTFIA